MKLKDGFVLRTVKGETVAIPTGRDMELNRMITLNETGKLLWELLEKGADTQILVQALLDTYSVDRETAEDHVQLFVDKLNGYGFME